jgi:hypothetical protein
LLVVIDENQEDGLLRNANGLFSRMENKDSVFIASHGPQKKHESFIPHQHHLLTFIPSSSSSIQIPHKLFKDLGYDHREALFGMPPYGGSIAQNVFYADSDLCDPTVDTSKGFPTRDIDPKTKKQAPWPSPYILMVDRGGCTFVQKVRIRFGRTRSVDINFHCLRNFNRKKAIFHCCGLHLIFSFSLLLLFYSLQVRNAQRSGAAGVLIADNTCLCNDDACTAANPGTTCEMQEPIMADDGKWEYIIL